MWNCAGLVALLSITQLHPLKKCKADSTNDVSSTEHAQSSERSPDRSNSESFHRADTSLLVHYIELLENGEDRDGVAVAELCKLQAALMNIETALNDVFQRKARGKRTCSQPAVPLQQLILDAIGNHGTTAPKQRHAKRHLRRPFQRSRALR